MPRRVVCAGVDRAIEIVEILLEQHGAPVYVRHQIVHNDHVVKRLEGLGAVFVDHENDIPAGAICVLRARCRAVGARQLRVARPARGGRGLPARLEGSCRGAALRRQRPPGRARRPCDHVEVIGTRGERPEATVVIESPEDAAKLDSGGKPIAVITQTTLSLDDVAETVDALGERFGDLSGPPRTTSVTPPRTGRTRSRSSPSRAPR